jgi:hypothetical protein
MPEDSQSRFERVYRWVSRLSALGLIFGLAFLVAAFFKILGHLEDMAPAELRLLLAVFKNRFFQ